MELKTLNLFHTPESMREVEDYLLQVREPVATVAAMMMYNLLVSKYNLTPKEEV